VRLPEARSKRAFQMYVDWCYNNEPKIDDSPASGDKEEVSTELVELYLLGDVLDDIKLRNKILRLLNAQICEDCQELWHLSPSDYNLIWNHTTPNSLFRKWAVDAMVSAMPGTCFEENIALWPTYLSQQLAIKYMNQLEGLEGYGSDYEGLEKRLKDYMEADTDA
jgi:hypothetical protein